MSNIVLYLSHFCIQNWTVAYYIYMYVHVIQYKTLRGSLSVNRDLWNHELEQDFPLIAQFLHSEGTWAEPHTLENLVAHLSKNLWLSHDCLLVPTYSVCPYAKP